MQKDYLTDVAENLPENNEDLQGMRDDSGNQQVISPDGEVITLGQNGGRTSNL